MELIIISNPSIAPNLWFMKKWYLFYASAEAQAKLHQLGREMEFLKLYQLGREIASTSPHQETEEKSTQKSTQKSTLKTTENIAENIVENLFAMRGSIVKIIWKNPKATAQSARN